MVGSRLRSGGILTLVVVFTAPAFGGWRSFPTPTTKDINAVKVVSAGEAWAVGYWGEILHYANGSWTIYHNWMTPFLQDVDFNAPNFGVAVGADGSCAFFRGSSWVWEGITSNRDMYAVGIPRNQTEEAWAAGENGELWRWYGGVWTRVNLNTTHNIHDLFWSATGYDGWLVGDLGLCYHNSGSGWVDVNILGTTTHFYCINALAANNVWVGGAGGKLYHWEGVAWAPVATPTAKAIREMAFNGPTDGWAVCDGGVILHYNGVEWSAVTSTPPTAADFSGLSMWSAQSGWAVGGDGTIYEYRNYPNVTPSSLGRVKAALR